MGAVLTAPARDADAPTIVDWLELKAFFDPYQEAKLDEFNNSIAIQEEGNDEDFVGKDAELEGWRDEIEQEITYRERSLKELYPFILSENCEILSFKQRTERRRANYYILCLLLSHATRSPVLGTPPKDQVLGVARNYFFQALATAAVAGFARGPAIWVGWPRPTDSTILQVVDRACGLSGTGSARDAPSPNASPYDKDHGIDVLAWEAANDRPPPLSFVFGQTASGHNWKGKSAAEDAESLRRNYYLDQPDCQYRNVTLVPHRLSDNELRSNQHRHGTILDRTRLPLQADHGIASRIRGVEVDGLAIEQRLWHWMKTYKRNPENGNYIW